MSSDGNDDVTKTVNNGAKSMGFTGDPLADITNFAVNYWTSGLVGMKDGKITKGVLTNAVDEGVGEVTGRNAARKELMNNNDRVEAERLARAKELKDKQALDARNDLAASNAAGAKTQSLGTDLAMQADQKLSKDFLGL